MRLSNALHRPLLSLAPLFLHLLSHRLFLPPCSDPFLCLCTTAKSAYFTPPFCFGAVRDQQEEEEKNKHTTHTHTRPLSSSKLPLPCLPLSPHKAPTHTPQAHGSPCSICNAKEKNTTPPPFCTDSDTFTLLHMDSHYYPLPTPPNFPHLGRTPLLPRKVLPTELKHIERVYLHAHHRHIRFKKQA